MTWLKQFILKYFPQLPKMYYKDSPYGHASYPQPGYTGGQYPTRTTPLLPHDYDDREMMYGNVANTMDTIKAYFTKPLVIVITVILVLIIIAWLMGSSKEKYYHY